MGAFERDKKMYSIPDTMHDALCDLRRSAGRALCPVLCLLLLFSGCGEPDKPKDLMPESEYTDLLLEVFITQHLIQLKELTDKRDSVMTDLFDRYNVTEEEFQRSHQYYQIQTDGQKERIDRMREILREERTKIDEARQSMNESDESD